MKKALLPLALMTVLPSIAQADINFYGRANVSLQNADELAGGSKTEVVSNNSRIGLKGGESISDSLKVIYQFEYQTEVDDGNGPGGTFSQRNIFVGLEGSGGTVIAGLFDTPVKVVQEKVDLFNDMEGDILNIFNGEIRARNIVQYTTPKSWGGISSSIAYITQEDESLDDGISASIGYTGSQFFVGVAVDSDVIQDVDLMRVVARYTFGPVQLGALYETVDTDGFDEDGALVSAMFSLSDKWKLKAQYGQSDVKAPDAETTSVGLDYLLSKNSTVYGYYTQVENGIAVEEAGARDDNYLGVGIDYRF